jgi:hypothetical protein
MLASMDDLDEFGGLWTDSSGRYVLVQLSGWEPEQLLPFDRIEHHAVLIDDVELSAAVIARMLHAGVAVVEGLPG